MQVIAKVFPKKSKTLEDA